ncbi:hypothetical protein Dvul_2796 [Nitratidesulfovibrio vulgaris DP4]|uniref:Uncharacterized protein n=1 Tax=Nitratidesulfovibrio vulgaris (strain DP4) TaxID=391774 RepID=A0A0H3ABT8_NITV4|nr:hypothetical protein Dvul_2796 [Nitratidesulfovibrio vulgaris DP4]
MSGREKARDAYRRGHDRMATPLAGLAGDGIRSLSVGVNPACSRRRTLPSCPAERRPATPIVAVMTGWQPPWRGLPETASVRCRQG